jgi:hypothetical protein
MREAPSWKGDNPGVLRGLCARSDGESRGKAKRKERRKISFAQSLGHCAGAHLFLGCAKHEGHGKEKAVTCLEKAAFHKKK